MNNEETGLPPGINLATTVDTLIIGGGSGGTAILRAFNNYPWVNISGIVDIDNQAPGLHLARQHDVVTYNDVDLALAEFQGEVIIDVTASQEMADFLKKQQINPDVEVISGRSAWLMFGLIEGHLDDQQQLGNKQSQIKLLTTMLHISQELESGSSHKKLLNRGVEGSSDLIVSSRGIALEYRHKKLLMLGGVGVGDINTMLELDEKTSEALVDVFISEHTLNSYSLDQPVAIDGIAGKFNIAIPIHIDGNLVFSLLFQTRGPLAEDVRQSLVLLIGHLQMALRAEMQSQSLQEMAFRDPLTGIYNRRFFDDRLEDECSRNLRMKEGLLALMYIDVDDFKVANDSHGHLFGDSLLRYIVDCIRACLRPYDTFARYGGDEFAIILPAISSHKEVGNIVDRILTALREQAPAEMKGFAEVSIGIAYSEHSRPVKPHDMVHHADIALYQAKKKGKNQACFYRDVEQQTAAE